MWRCNVSKAARVRASLDDRSFYGPGLGSLLASKAGEAARKLSGQTR
jgi:hypothetical protein